VPEGNPDDKTRLPEYYDGLYGYLKDVGIEEIRMDTTSQKNEINLSRRRHHE